MKGEEDAIVKILVENKGRELNVSSITRLARKEYKTTHSIVKRLEKQGIVKTSIFGKALKVELASGSNPLTYQVEYARRKDILKDKNLHVTLDSVVKGLSSRFFILLLFGSHARKASTKHSDIDLLFIVPDKLEPQFEREINSITSTIPLPLHVIIFTESQFKDMKNSRVKTVGSEAMLNNVILHGIESYYELIE